MRGIVGRAVAECILMRPREPGMDVGEGRVAVRRVHRRRWRSSCWPDLNRAQRRRSRVPVVAGAVAF